jgi:hypothetical protein
LSYVICLTGLPDLLFKNLKAARGAVQPFTNGLLPAIPAGCMLKSGPRINDRKFVELGLIYHR